MRITNETLSTWFRGVAEIMAEQCDLLCEMDAKMGDGDLGITMKKGFGALPDLIDEIDEPDMGKRLMKAGMKMASVVPSTMGTLMSSGVMSGGKAIAGLSELDAAGYLRYLEGFCSGIEKRGKCSRGDRTVLDAIATAAERLDGALSANPALSLEEAEKVAVEGAREGVEATKSMVPKFGKAAVHKAAAENTADQGACAGLYMLIGYAGKDIK